MRAKIIVFSLIAFTLTVFITSAVYADCQAGKKEITIVNPAGKAITICVPDAAIPNIGGDGDVVIPATCPCFSQEEVQAEFDEYPNYSCTLYEGRTDITWEPCSYIVCDDDTSDTVFQSLESLEGQNCSLIVANSLALSIMRPHGCLIADETSFYGESTSTDEAKVCAETLKTFDPEVVPAYPPQ
jgi:hypothetical protein